MLGVRTLAALSLVSIAAPAPLEAKVYRDPAFVVDAPDGWQLRVLPKSGRPPRERRIVELTRRLNGGLAKIEIEADGSERLGKNPLYEARMRAWQTAQMFDFQGYDAREMRVKQAPGFYESWTANPPGLAPMRVVAATFFRGGTRFRVSAVCPLGSEAPIAEAHMRHVLRSWQWTAGKPAKRR